MRLKLRLMQDNRILAELEHPRTTGPAHHMSSTSHTAITSLSNTLNSSTVPTCMASYSANFMSSLSTSGLDAVHTLGGLTSASTAGLGTTSLSGATGLLGTSGGLASSGLGKIGLDRATAGGLGGGVTSSVSSHALTSHYGDALGGLGGTLSGTGPLGGVSISTANVSPLPMRAHMNTMPPMCQV